MKIKEGNDDNNGFRYFLLYKYVLPKKRQKIWQ